MTKKPNVLDRVVHARLSKEEHAAVEEAAEDDARTMANMVRRLVLEALEARERRKAEETAQ